MRGVFTTSHHPNVSFSVHRILDHVSCYDSSGIRFRGCPIPKQAADSVLSHTYDERLALHSYVLLPSSLSPHAPFLHAYTLGTHDCLYPTPAALACSNHLSYRTSSSAPLSCTLPSYPTPSPTVWTSSNLIFSPSTP